MKNIENNCLQGLKRQNKLLTNTICLKKLFCISKKKPFAEVQKKKEKFAEEHLSYPPPPPPSRIIMVHPLSRPKNY